MIVVGGGGYVPDRGHVVKLSFDPQLGHEQAGFRPALILSPAAYNDLVSLAVMCPITGQAKGYPFEVTIPTGLAVAGVVLSDHVKSLDWRARNAKFLCTVPNATVQDVLQKLQALLT